MSKMTHFGNRVGAFAGTIAIARALFNRSQEIVKPSHPRRLCLATLEEQPDRKGRPARQLQDSVQSLCLKAHYRGIEDPIAHRKRSPMAARVFWLGVQMRSFSGGFVTSG